MQHDLICAVVAYTLPVGVETVKLELRRGLGARAVGHAHASRFGDAVTTRPGQHRGKQDLRIEPGTEPAHVVLVHLQTIVPAHRIASIDLGIAREPGRDGVPRELLSTEAS